MKNLLHNLSGEQKQQLLIICDKKGNPGGTETREICHEGNGKPHLAFMAFIMDEDDHIILAKRSSNKSLWAGFWDASVVSHVLPDEKVEQAAQRRSKEEMGIDIEFQDVGAFYYFKKFNTNCENEYCHVLIGKSIQLGEFNPVEIESIRKITIDDLKKEILDCPGIFTPWLKIALEKIDIKI